MASPDPSNIKIERKTETDDINIDCVPTELRDGMKRWTNGLPGATKRLGAKMAFEVFPLVSLGCARIPMMARSKLLHFRGLIH